MYLIKTPTILQAIAPGFMWRGEARGRALYLTFDDGPIPEATPWVLDTLARFDAKATFFCVGDNVRKYPEIYQRILREGHSVGNHTYNHLKGRQTSLGDYMANTRRCSDLVDSNLFRPPYGSLSYRQCKALAEHYRIVMWDVLSGDFDPSVSKEQCLHNVVQHARPGSIVVFHDNLKTMEKLRYVLPETLSQLRAQGYRFCALPHRVSQGAERTQRAEAASLLHA